MEGPREVVLRQSLCFNFQARNNQVEYEAIISSLTLARDVGITHLLVLTDSPLIASQIIGCYQTKDPLLLKYLQLTLQSAKGITKFEVDHIPQKENFRANILDWFANAKGHVFNRIVIQ